MPLTDSTATPLYYEVAGQGPPVCLINGYRLNGAAWPCAFVAGLASRCTVVVFDNRGTGRSAKPDDGYQFSNQARDVVELLDHLRLPRASLLGYSMGGAIAQEIAIRHADRVHRLILFATFCGGVWAEPAPLSVLSRIFFTDGLSPEEAARQSWPVTYSPEYLAANGDAAERQMRRELEHPTPSFVARHQMDALRAFDSYRRLPRIAAATLVATGTHDLLVKPRNAAILAARIPNARLETLADLGHRAIWEAPEEIAELIGDFLTGPNAAAGGFL
jgi:pimeloyl-ACP methyl ester carboxylesterase